MRPILRTVPVLALLGSACSQSWPVVVIGKNGEEATLMFGRAAAGF
jgi:hypothetical protein